MPSVGAAAVDPLASPEMVPVAQRGVVGEGDRTVKILLGQTHSFGPINVRSKEEAGLLMALVKEKCDAASHRGKTVHEAPQYFSIAEHAKSVLHPEVVKFIHYAFTLRGLREHQLGRRRNINRGRKKSQIIKIGRNGEFVYPPGHPSNGTSMSSITEEQDEANNNAPIVKQVTSSTSPDFVVNDADDQGHEPEFDWGEASEDDDRGYVEKKPKSGRQRGRPKKEPGSSRPRGRPRKEPGNSRPKGRPKRVKKEWPDTDDECTSDSMEIVRHNKVSDTDDDDDDWADKKGFAVLVGLGLHGEEDLSATTEPGDDSRKRVRKSTHPMRTRSVNASSYCDNM